MRTKNIFTLGFFLTIVPVFWVIISFARDGEFFNPVSILSAILFARDGEFFNPVSILSAILGGLLVTFAARRTLESDSKFPKGPPK